MLDQVYLFAGLTPEELDVIRQHAVNKRYRKNTVIIERGDDANTLYVLLSGQVKAYVADDDNGKEIVLNQKGPGAVLGELALLAGIPRTASVMTLEESEFVVLSKRSFMQILSDHPNIAFNLIRALANQVSDLTESVTDLALLDVYGRLVKVLNDSATEEDGRLLTPRFTQQELADRVGATREMISKILRDLKAGEYVSVEGKRYVIQRKLPPKW